MMVVYILFSDSLKKFYTGFTTNLEQRMEFHNAGKNKFTSKGVPWKVVATFEVSNVKEGLALEKRIKKNGAKRYLERNYIENKL